ncbi:energy-coupling factor ABC transporter permease [Mangrovibacterium diazotrophicum]|uniref:Cobalt transport protein CbiM n=1 Tax=Mangrovibacterium diazotrophicum TaxID=1261403 RepID=A0A419W4J5_9BACT|nr:energy-coupling factor ABC transporter permease [Mangrovibacterium diazotrophicum]RKD90378.1 cobalt/nickel transport system permease protein [Mangrovibacterium diazotrophicum]
MTKKRVAYLGLGIFLPGVANSMHIAEGFLPASWCIVWWAVYLAVLIAGFSRLKQTISEHPNAKLLFAAVAAYVFILSSLKLPSVAGSSSHLTGIALGALLFGASCMSVVGLIVLLFQALLLAHGGLTTLGANGFSMAVCGAFSAVWVFRLLKGVKTPQWLAVGGASFVSNLVIYSCTSAQLAVAFADSTAAFNSNLIKFLSIFAVTQLPLSIIESVFTVLAFQYIQRTNKAEIQELNPNLYETKNSHLPA